MQARRSTTTASQCQLLGMEVVVKLVAPCVQRLISLGRNQLRGELGKSNPLYEVQVRSGGYQQRVCSIVGNLGLKRHTT